jgi:hypothetical protein
MDGGTTITKNVKVKLSFCTAWKPKGGVDIKLHSFLNSALYKS